MITALLITTLATLVTSFLLVIAITYYKMKAVFAVYDADLGVRSEIE